MSYALLTFALNHVTELQQRQIFNKKMEEEQWIKVNKINTAWKYSSQTGTYRDKAILTSKQDVKNAAQYAGIKSYNAVLQIGEVEVEEF